MKLYVIRHGTTDLNNKNLYNGRCDEDINEEGIREAKEARDKLLKYNIDIIISSPMKRTRHTAEIINVNNLEIILDEHFIERDLGELTLTKVNHQDPKEYWKYKNSKYKGLETISEIEKRVFEGLENINEKYKDKNVLIVTHAAITRMIKIYCEKIPVDENVRYIETQKNGEIKVYEL